MRKWFGLVLLLCLCKGIFANDNSQGDFQKPVDPWFGLDKLKHVSSAFIMTTTGYYLQHRIMDRTQDQSLYSTGLITFTIGLGKEAMDKNRSGGFFSIRDLIANGAGIGLAVLFIKGIE
jgi:hypothetical protein